MRMAAPFHIANTTNSSATTIIEGSGQTEGPVGESSGQGEGESRHHDHEGAVSEPSSPLLGGLRPHSAVYSDAPLDADLLFLEDPHALHDLPSLNASMVSSHDESQSSSLPASVIPASEPPTAPAPASYLQGSAAGPDEPWGMALPPCLPLTSTPRDFMYVPSRTK
jgi:hypothetical protein